jgi:3-hydroxyisobutyrate dehydrogenase-like beta-hydroxyacid dehydrogenase
MAANLLKHNVDLTVYNRSPEPAQRLGEAGAIVANTPSTAVKGADLVFSMLSTPEVVEQLAFGEEGFTSFMKRDAVWADVTTVDPMFARKIAQGANRQGIRYIDSPVAGTKPHAENAQLVFYVGGDKTDYELARPYMEMMGQKAMHIGGVGGGASLKMLVNMMLAQSMLVYSEAVLLGKSMGLDESLLFDVLPTLPVIAPFTKFKTEMIKNDDYTVQFPLEWMQKDLHLASLCAYEFKQPLFMTNLAKEIYGQAVNAGLARHDFGAVFKYLSSKH